MAQISYGLNIKFPPHMKSHLRIWHPKFI